MNDRPSAVELLRAVERFLEDAAVPGLDGVQRYHARVAANVVAIVAREIETEDAHQRAEWAGLSGLLGIEAALPPDRAARCAALLERNAELSRRIRAGDADAGPWRDRVLAHLRETVAAKLEVARPPRQKRNGGPGGP
ncbi:MAG: hypothetical protein JSU66_10330 [Deltaproteobacteria bacterium]|nr:MAG: hypothetical protein JSU66_10330 [Deltaproteobacteria bacterium]